MVSKEDGANWRLQAISQLRSIGVSSFNPMSAFGFVNLSNRESVKALVEINEAAMLRCNAAIFLMSASQPSIGTPMELLLCHQHGIPTVVIWDTKDWSANLPAYITHYGGKVVADVNAAVDAIGLVKSHAVTSGATGCHRKSPQ